MVIKKICGAVVNGWILAGCWGLADRIRGASYFKRALFGRKNSIPEIPCIPILIYSSSLDSSASQYAAFELTTCSGPHGSGPISPAARAERDTASKLKVEGIFFRLE